jgi:hypothetical protein
MIKVRFLGTFFFFILLVLTGNSQPLQIDWQHCYGGTQYDEGYTTAKTSKGLFLFGGTDSSDGDIPLNHGGGDYWFISVDTNGNIIWTKTYGGSGDDICADMKPTPDGGFILFGTSYTDNNYGQVTGNHGGGDYWLVKIDSIGSLQWQKCLGGSDFEYASKVDVTQDSGFICIGYTDSYDGDVTGVHGHYDAWVVKVNRFGSIQWQQTFGGTDFDYGMCVHATDDNGAIVGGYSGAPDGNISCFYHGGSDDAWIAKLDSSGNIEWQKCYGGSDADGVRCITPTSDGGYICAGGTTSNDGDVSGNHGGIDIWVFRIDHWGNLQWQRCYGGSQDDGSTSIKESFDENLFICGYTYSFDGDVHRNRPLVFYDSDMWVIKCSPSGDLIWQRCLGGEGDEGVLDMTEPDNGRLMLIGHTNWSGSYDVDCVQHGWQDFWFVSGIDSTYVGSPVLASKRFEILVRPNPANQYLHFITSRPAYSSAAFIRIFNDLGSLVGSVKLENDQSEVQVPCDNLSPGLYFFQYTYGYFIGTGKIMIYR